MLDLSTAHPRKHVRQHIGLYIVFLKEVKCGDLRYGSSYYDYEEGALVFFAPIFSQNVVPSHRNKSSFLILHQTTEVPG